jgi:hypothetical protein
MEKRSETAPLTELDWKPVGTVVGNAGIGEFTFILKQYQARVGDIVALQMNVPTSDYTSQRVIYVWARITDIHRFNPFFPFEAAQELAAEDISLESTILSGARDQLEANCLIIGSTNRDNFSQLFPLTYPVKPACKVYHPPAEAIKQLLIGGREGEKKATIGTLISREDVDVTLASSKIVARHMAILAMTGGGKTVAARRIIRELIRDRYPLFILDPHGDYIGLAKCMDQLTAENPGCRIKLFYPELLIQEGGEELVLRLIAQMTTVVTESQGEYIRALFNRLPAKNGTEALEFIGKLIKLVEADQAGARAPAGAPNNWRGTVGAARRGLRIVHEKLQRMKLSSAQMRESSKLKDLPWEPLPNPFAHPDDIIRPHHVSILYLGGYDHITQCSIAAITLETLFDFRAKLTGQIPPFFTVIEEAHTFIPSAREGTQDAVSLPVIRRIITEGRKFGTGLMLISQRPNRLDETIISQCNSFLILRLVNPNDQRFVRNIMENLTEADSKLIPGFGPGQGIVSGQAVRFPLPVQVRMDKDLLASELGDEDFFEQAEAWTPDSRSGTRKTISNAMDTLKRKRGRPRKN